MAASRSGPAGKGTGRRDGFVLVSVLSVMALFALMVGAVSLLVRSSVESMRIAGDDLVADALVRAGLELAAYQLFALRRPAEEVDTQQIRLDSGLVTLFVQPEGGKIDLNAASAELLAGAYRSARLTGLTPEAFAARVVDWRDPDGERSRQGAEASDYAAAGLDYRPQNGAFRSVDELQWLLGLRAADVGALSGLLTVNNPAGTVALFEAPRAVLLALPGVTAPVADRILALRKNRSDAAEAEIMRLLAEQQDLVSAEPGAAFAVTIEVRRDGGFVRTARAVLTPAASPDALYYVVDWAE